MKILLISDTHSMLDERVVKYAKSVDEIWHAGDVGDYVVLEKLRELAPVQAVYGNIDHGQVRNELPEFLWFTRSGVSILMTHIAGRPGRYSKPLLSELSRRAAPDVIVCGHSHILMVKMDKKFQSLWLNPGACGDHGFHKTKTLLRFDITDGKVKNMELIEFDRKST